MIRLRFGDLVLSSNTPLPVLPPAANETPECSFRLLGASTSGYADERWDHSWRSPRGEIALSCARDGDAYRLGMPGLATFLIDAGGGAITCRPHETLPPRTLEHLLIDQVLPRVLTHRGRLVLHAGCVATPHGALGFLGDSGAGKSTLCAEFARAGHPLLGDDGILVRRAPESGYEALATYPGLRLLPEPLAHLFDDQAGTAPVAHYTEKRRLDRDSGGFTLAPGAEPLLALYLLGVGTAVDIAPLPKREAFMALVGASFQLHLDDPERSRGHFERLGALLDTVPVRRLSYPRELDRIGAVRCALLADVETLATPASSEECACS